MTSKPCSCWQEVSLHGGHCCFDDWPDDYIAHPDAELPCGHNEHLTPDDPSGGVVIIPHAPIPMPDLGDTVHYADREPLGGPVECRAGLVTKTWDDGPASLRVFYTVKELDFDARRVPHDDWAGPDTPVGTWHTGHGEGT